MAQNRATGFDPLDNWLMERTRSLSGAKRSANLDRVLLSSDFAFEELRRRPELLALLKPRSKFIEARPAPTDADVSCSLRRFRRSQSLAILIDDTLDRVDLKTTLGRTTELAEICIDVALRTALAELVERHGQPRDAHGEVQQIVILGLGKLGSRELNFSSDIDLIASFPSAGETDGRRSLDNEDFFARLVQKTSAYLGETTEEGFGYRVDWRLRPFGSAGRLALSFDAMEDYYQREGREWERFALLRARPVAGDIASGNALMARLRPFVWRRYFDYAALEGLRELKALVDQEVRRREREQDLKLGPGGIREIEFRVQLESIIRGGRDPALRQSNTLELIDILAQREVLSAVEARELELAYRFLRKLENRVQMLRDEQTHILPDQPAAQQRYARSLGFADYADLCELLDRHRAIVSSAFERCLPMTGASKPHPSSAMAADLRLWQAVAPLTEQSASTGLTAPHPWAHTLKQLADTATVRAMSARGRSRLDRIMPLVLSACRRAGDSDLVLQRWIDLLAAIAGRTSYLALLAERPALIDRVTALFKSSAWLARALAQSPILLDDLLDARLAQSPATRAELDERLRLELSGVDAGDSEQELERVRQFQQSARLEIALSFLDGRSDAAATAAALAQLAGLIIEALLAMALRDLKTRHGRLPGLENHQGIAVIGYGSLGGHELNFSSDLDLVFLYNESLQNAESEGVAAASIVEAESAPTSPQRVLDGQRYVARVVQRLLHLLTVQTAFGPLYEIDARLRPNGSKGMLVTPLSAYASYQDREAWLWEHQAMVRSRFVCGDAAIGDEFKQLRQRVLLRPRDAVIVASEVSQMRARWRAALDRSNADFFDLKQGHGGLVDIEFGAQERTLRLQIDCPSNSDPPAETSALLSWLEQHGAISSETAATQSRLHARLLDRGLRCALALQPRVIAKSEAADLLHA